MRFEPLTDEQIDALNPKLEEGECNFVVIKAADLVSQAGNDKINLEIKLTSPNGASITAYDNLVGTKKAMWKIKEYCLATNNMHSYDTGQLTAIDCRDNKGKCLVKKDKATGYMNINKYLSKEDSIQDEQIPF